MTSDHSLMEFPCDFQIKIIGKNTSLFATEISNIVKKHFPKTKKKDIRHQMSQQGNFLAISATLHVLDQVSLDALYMELTKHPDIQMVL